MAEQTFIVLGEPTGKARPRVTRFGSYTPEATVMYENLVKVEYRRQCRDFRFEDGELLRMVIRAEYAIPMTTSKRKRQLMLSGQIRPTKKPDLTNILKIIEDALNKIAYKDDSQIVSIVAEKFYSLRPRVEVQISSLSAP